MPENSLPILNGKIVEWDDQKGYGFVQAGQRRFFLHNRDFARRHKRPAAGDAISFTLGKDLKGRPCATNAIHLNGCGRITAVALIFIVALLVLPGLALLHQQVDLRWAGLYVLALSLISYRCYANDKCRAQKMNWRVSENSLHLTALLGGWPGAFLSQRQFRHKVSKFGFQFVFWLIVLIYQLAAFDALQNWRLSKQVWNQIRGVETHHRQTLLLTLFTFPISLCFQSQGGAGGR